MKCESRQLSLPQRALLPTRDPLVLRALRSKLCLLLTMKREINVKREILSGLLERMLLLEKTAKIMTGHAMNFHPLSWCGP